MQRIKFYGSVMAALTAIGLILKLANPGSLSWWLVTAPLWGPPLFILIGCVMCAVIIGAVMLLVPGEK